MLGVCLGHQALALVAGGAVEHAGQVMHGRLSEIEHTGDGLFAGVPQRFSAVRYHSLVVDRLPPELRVTAWTSDGVVMGLEHRERPLLGVQFHPESVLTDHGATLLTNFRELTERHRSRRGRGLAPPLPARHTAGAASPRACPRIVPQPARP